MPRFTKTYIDRLTLPPGKSQIAVKDDVAQNPLRIKVGKSAKTFYLIKDIDGRTKTITLGRYGRDLTLDEAYAKRRELLDSLDDGTYLAPEDKPLSHSTISELLEEYIDDRGERLAARTARDYRDDVRRLGWGDRRACDIDAQEVVKAYKARRAVAPRSAVAEFGTLKTIYRHFEIDPDPTRVIEKRGLRPKSRKSEKRFVDSEEWAKALFAAREYGGVLADLWEALAFTGLRPQEVRLIETDHVDLPGRVLRIPRANLKAKSREGDLFVPITEPLEAVLRRRLALNGEGRWVFPGHIRGCPVKEYGAVVRAVKKAMPEPGRIEAYSLRRHYITEMVRAGVPFEHRCKLVDHDNPHISDGYIRLTVEDLRPHAERVAEIFMEAVDEVLRNNSAAA